VKDNPAYWPHFGKDIKVRNDSESLNSQDYSSSTEDYPVYWPHHTFKDIKEKSNFSSSQDYPCDTENNPAYCIGKDIKIESDPSYDLSSLSKWRMIAHIS